MAGGVALNCVANSRIWREGPFERVWVQPAAGDAGTALGAALHVAHELGDAVAPMADRRARPRLGRRRARGAARTAGVAFERPATSPTPSPRCSPTTASWRGSRAARVRPARARAPLAARRSAPAENLERLNDIKGREQFRPVAPMVLAERAAEIFDGPVPSPYMLFTHDVRAGVARAHPRGRARGRDGAHPDRRRP